VSLVKKRKTRDCFGNRGFENSCSYKSTFHSHDAQKTGVALANGHPAIDRRVLQHCCKRSFHFLNRQKETPFRLVCQRVFSRVENCVVGFMRDVKLIPDMSEPLRMVTCGWCETKVFIPGDLAPLATVPCSKCGHPIMMPMRLRQFELRSVIGSGGMGNVYRGWDTVLERMVAVKLMKKELLEDPKALESFYREARACARLNHTNIVHIYTFDEWEGQQYLVMELADRGSLDARIEKLHALPELDVLDIGIKIASALDMALKYDLLHRDIKPGNILFNADHEPKLVDFGLARKADIEHEIEDMIWGTPYYVAPEKIKREPETFLSDMYSLGATLYHAMTGHVPFDAPTPEEVIVAQVQTPLTPPNLVVPEITQPTSDAIVRALAKSPADRFLSYDEFIMALEAARSFLLRQQSQSPNPPNKPKGMTSWWKRG
jgi:serine/threonine protein kinase